MNWLLIVSPSLILTALSSILSFVAKDTITDNLNDEEGRTFIAYKTTEALTLTVGVLALGATAIQTVGSRLRWEKRATLHEALGVELKTICEELKMYKKADLHDGGKVRQLEGIPIDRWYEKRFIQILQADKEESPNIVSTSFQLMETYLQTNVPKCIFDLPDFERLMGFSQEDFYYKAYVVMNDTMTSYFLSPLFYPNPSSSVAMVERSLRKELDVKLRTKLRSVLASLSAFDKDETKHMLEDKRLLSVLTSVLVAGTPSKALKGSKRHGNSLYKILQRRLGEDNPVDPNVTYSDVDIILDAMNIMDKKKKRRCGNFTFCGLIPMFRTICCMADKPDENIAIGMLLHDYYDLMRDISERGMVLSSISSDLDSKV